jgi:hypothetical protein
MKIKFSKQAFLSGFGIVVRLVLGGMFLISALPKLRQPYDFLGEVYAYEIVGPKLGMLAAMVLPWAELLVGICLLGSIFVGGALLVSAGMGAMFTVVLAWAIYHGLDITCGCFGTGSSRVGYGTLLRAMGITLFSFIGYLVILFIPSRELTTSSVQNVESGPKP